LETSQRVAIEIVPAGMDLPAGPVHAQAGGPEGDLRPDEVIIITYPDEVRLN